MVALKRKRPGQDYGEDEKLLHQATKALTKEAKRVRTFLLQQAIRKSKTAALKGKGKKKSNIGVVGDGDGIVDGNGDGDGDGGGGSGGDSTGQTLGKSQQGSAISELDGEETGLKKSAAAAAVAATVATAEVVPVVAAGVGGNKDACSDREPAGGGERRGGGAPSSSSSPASEEVSLIKGLQPSIVVKMCLRRLGLAHTGVDGEDEVKVRGEAKLQKLVSHVFEHKRVTTVMEELREKVTQRRREKMAESEGRSLPGQGRNASGRGKGKRMAAESGGGRQGGKRKVDSGRAHDAGSSGTAFVSLSGEAPSDEEWASGPARSRITRNKNDDMASKYGPSPSPLGRGGDRPARNEPGWAGAERAAGWGRGGGRAKNGRGGGGRGGRQGDNPGRQEGGRGGGGGGGGGRGHRGGGGGARGRREGRGGRGGGGGRDDGRTGGSFGSSGNGSRSSFGGGSASGNQKEESSGGQDLHGSWAAKRALKEKEASATKAFSGKRTTFGDDD